MNATMPPSELVKLLQRYAPNDPHSSACQALMIDHANTLEAPLSRRQLPAHFTGSALIVDESAERVCLVFHKKLDRWLQPGGHVESEDQGDIAKTAQREALEETGLDVRLLQTAPIHLDIHLIPARPNEPEHQHLDVRFLLQSTRPSLLQHDPSESNAAAWFSFSDAARKVNEPSFQQMLLAAQTLLRLR